jgi:hypothetical protein
LVILHVEHNPSDYGMRCRHRLGSSSICCVGAAWLKINTATTQPARTDLLVVVPLGCTKLLTFVKPLVIMLLRVLLPGLALCAAGAAAVLLVGAPPPLLLYWPLWREVDMRAAWRSAAAISRAC